VVPGNSNARFRGGGGGGGGRCLKGGGGGGGGGRGGGAVWGVVEREEADAGEGCVGHRNVGLRGGGCYSWLTIFLGGTAVENQEGKCTQPLHRKLTTKNQISLQKMSKIRRLVRLY